MKADYAFLETLRDSGALKEGHFLLASGRHSGQYVEKFDLLRNPAATSHACAAIAERYAHDAIDVVAGPTTGGVILAFEVARQLGVSAAFAERVADGENEREFRRGTTFPAEARVLVVDDILTTGGSIRETLAALRGHPISIVGVAVLVDRRTQPVDFGVHVVALASMEFETWDAADCPLCAAGVMLTKPGTTAARDSMATPNPDSGTRR